MHWESPDLGNYGARDPEGPPRPVRSIRLFVTNVSSFFSFLFFNPYLRLSAIAPWTSSATSQSTLFMYSLDPDPSWDFMFVWIRGYENTVWITGYLTRNWNCMSWWKYLVVTSQRAYAYMPYNYTCAKINYPKPPACIRAQGASWYSRVFNDSYVEGGSHSALYRVLLCLEGMYVLRRKEEQHQARTAAGLAECVIHSAE